MCTISFASVKSLIQTIIHYAANSSHIALIMSAGDIVMQLYKENKEIKLINWQRNFKFASIGLVFVGPILTYWSNIIKTSLSGDQSYVTKMLNHLFCNQVYFAPCLNFGIITMFGVLDHESVVKIEKRVSEYFPYIMRRYYILWPGVELFAKLCVQPKQQIIFEDFIAIFWYAYISGILHNDDKLKKI